MIKRLAFHAPFDFAVSNAVTVAYPAGFIGPVPRDHAAAALAAGVAKEVETHGEDGAQRKAVSKAARTAY